MVSSGMRALAFAFAGLTFSLAASIGLGQGGTSNMPANAASAGTKFIDAWAVSFTPTTVNGAVQTQQTFSNQTLRLNVFSKLAGSEARVKFTNRFSTVPLTITAAHIANRTEGTSIDPATDRPLTFGGKTA